MRHIALLMILFLVCLACKSEKKENTDEEVVSWLSKKEKQLIKVSKTKEPILIDGNASETIWSTTQWQVLDQFWLGNPVDSTDFSGRYKLSWDENALYLLAEIQDDTLIDIYKDPLKQWWDDDCLEVFVDEDNSGGEHQFNHNAFAYHIALDGNVVDMSSQKEGKLYNSHVESSHKTEGNLTLWEVKIHLYDNTYNDDSTTNQPIKVSANKKVGFALAYCDNDYSETREHFIGSIPVEGEDKNRGWIDANIFGTLKLIDN